MMLTLVSCQTFAPISKLAPELRKPCPVFDFDGGKLMPQVIALKREYELCKVQKTRY